MNLSRKAELKLLKIVDNFLYGFADGGDAKAFLDVQSIFRECLISYPFPLEEFSHDLEGRDILLTQQEEEGRLRALKIACNIGWRRSVNDGSGHSAALDAREAYRVISEELLRNGGLGIGRTSHAPDDATDGEA